MSIRTTVKTFWPALVLSLAGSLAGCKVSTGTGVSGPPAPGGGGGGESGGGGGGAVAGGPSCENPADHCLQPDDVFVADGDFAGGYVSTYVGKEVAPKNAAGEARFMMLHDGSEKTSKYFWKTHPATDQEVVVGALVMALDMNSEGGYRAPASREEATGGAWFLSRIVSVDTLAQGTVIVSGGYTVRRDNLRRIEGDTSPTVTAPGTEDQWFVKPEHWFISDNPLPAQGYVSAWTAYAIKPPSKETGGEGQFLATHDGKVLWTKHAWRTRPASKDDLKLGAMVVALDMNSEAGYRAPQSRTEAIHGTWFIAKITDVSTAYKGTVTLAGQYSTQIAGLRVILP